MRVIALIALFAVATNAIVINDEPKTDAEKGVAVHTEEEEKVGKFAFKAAAEGDRISQGRNATTAYVKPLDEVIQEQAQADAIKAKQDHSAAVWKNAQDVTKAAKDPKDLKKEDSEDAKKEAEGEAKKE